MKNLILASLVTTLGAGALQAQELKMDSYTRQIADMYTSTMLYPQAKHISIPGYEFITDAKALSDKASKITCLIKLADGVAAEQLEDYGLTVTDADGCFATATGTIGNIIAVAGSDCVVTVSIDREQTALTDLSRKLTGIDDIHNGTGLPQKYDGTGVICGLYDTGLDPNHVNFYDRAFTRNRVQRLWRYTGTDGSTTGSYTNENISNFTTDNTSETHGTHVLGCMAGGHNTAGNSTGTTKPQGSNALINSSGNGVTTLTSRKNPYYGMAPGADIAIGCGPLYSSNMLSAASNIINYAESENKPVVINLSIGNNRGPHDGSDVFSQRMDKLAERAIVVLAAGNDGDTDISVVRKFQSGDTSFKTLLSSKTNYTGSIEIWSSDAQHFTVSPVIYNKATNEIVFQTDFDKIGSDVLASSTYTTPGYIHDINFDQAFKASSVTMTGSANTDTNNRYSVSISVAINYNATTNKDGNLELGFIVKGKPGQRADLVWQQATGMTNLVAPADGWTAGNADLSYSGMACGKNIISVGSYNSRSRWPSFGGVYTFNDLTGMEADQISGFSSYGELADGRKMPMITAPGCQIISSISSYSTNNGGRQNSQSAYYTWNGRNYPYEGMMGTSMAAPIVSGIIATWLQANPHLNVDQVKNILKDTSTRDFDESEAIRWGYGKINAYQGLKAALAIDGAVNDIAADCKNDILVKAAGNTFEAFAAGADRVDIRLFNMTGVQVAAASAEGETATIDASAVAPGIYVLTVNNRHSQRVMVK